MYPNMAYFQILAVTLMTFHIDRCCAIICYKCDSVKFPSCATSLESNSFPTEECKNAFACAMTIVDSVTYRGCSTNTPRGQEYYKTCSENLCNKGVYPPGRLKCHQCSGKDCVPAPTEKPTPCLYFNENDHCYTDVIDELDTFRGCNSDTTRTPNILAAFCDINGCNNLPGVTSLTCSKCDSADGRGCKINLFDINAGTCNITNETTCKVQALLGHENETCFLYHNLDRVVRGCTFDSGMLSLDSEHFEVCQTEFCNKKCLKQQKCIVCDSTSDKLCQSDPSSLTAVTCQSPEASSCYSCELTNGTVQRGCGVSTVKEAVRCNQCQGEACNKLSFTKCYKCTSDENPNCSQWTDSDAVDTENCEIAGADCISAVLDNGKTLRGCQSDRLRCNGTQSQCVPCSGNLCNEGVFPVMRLQCHHCDSRKVCSDVTNNMTLKSCSQYDKNDACFEFESGRGTMVRGCKSDHAMYYECLLVGSQCRLCAGHGCNMMPVTQKAALQCHTCSINDEACNWQQDSRSLKKCQKDVAFLSVESCFIRRYLNGTTSRGCTLDYGDTKGSAYDDFLMQTCTEEGCNNKAMITQKCLKCQQRSKYETFCTTVIDEYEERLCKKGLVKYEERGCYMRVNGGLAERGCASDLTDDDFVQCRNSDECSFCHGINCNTAPINLTLVGLRSVSVNVRPKLAVIILSFFSIFVKQIKI